MFLKYVNSEGEERRVEYCQMRIIESLNTADLDTQPGGLWRAASGFAAGM
jgi:hypothetical protein